MEEKHNHTDNKLKAIISCATSLEKKNIKQKNIESKFDKRNSDSFINNYVYIVTPKIDCILNWMNTTGVFLDELIRRAKNRKQETDKTLLGAGKGKGNLRRCPQNLNRTSVDLCQSM